MATNRPLQIFVSHSHEDNLFSHQLAADLGEALGGTATIWQDISGGLRGGDNWPRVIRENLAHCDVFLLVMSPAAMLSLAVQAELDMVWTRTLKEDVRIIPLLYKPCDPDIVLTTLQHISFVPPKSYQQAFKELVHALTHPRQTRPLASRENATRQNPTYGQDIPASPQPASAVPQVFVADSTATNKERASAKLGAMPLTLTIMSITNKVAPTRQTITDDVLTIGRNDANNLVIIDKTVSRYHLRIEHTQGGWHVLRLPNAGTLYLNGNVTTEATLNAGDQLVIGGTVLRIELPADLSEDIYNTPTIGITAATPYLAIDCSQYHFVAPLRGELITIGRSPDSVIVIPSPFISKHQAVMRLSQREAYVIEAITAANPMKLKGTAIHRRTLHSGDIITIGMEIPDQGVTLTYLALD